MFKLLSFRQKREKEDDSKICFCELLSIKENIYLQIIITLIWFVNLLSNTPFKQTVTYILWGVEKL